MSNESPDIAMETEDGSSQHEVISRERVHELRNRLYASSLAFRAICMMLDKGDPQAARAAAETMLAKLNDELDESSN